MDTPQEKNFNTIEKRTSHDLLCDLIVDTIEETINETPEGEDKKDYLLKTLSRIYGENLTQKIFGVLPDEIFIDEEKEKREEEAKMLRIQEIKEQAEAIKAQKLQNRGPQKRKKGWKKYAYVGIPTIPVVAGAIMAIEKPFDSKQGTEKNTEKTSIQVDSTNSLEKKLKADTTKNIVAQPEKIKMTFDREVYESLPEAGKEVYQKYYNESPTPGSGYEIVDKEQALMYVFDYQNNLIGKLEVGFGITEGDLPNTSNEYNKGSMTSPAGVYVISTSSTEGDQDEYGGIGFSLFGLSIRGDKVFLGEHPIYTRHGQGPIRFARMNDRDPRNNKFSNGCLNLFDKDIRERIMPYFKGDCSELCWILPDQKSRQSGFKFNVNILTKKIMPTIINWAKKEKEVYGKSLSGIQTIINQLQQDTIILEKNRANLVEEYKKDKNVAKQKKIEEIKKEIQNKKQELSKQREVLNDTYNKIEEVEAKHNNAEKVLSMSN